MTTTFVTFTVVTPSRVPIFFICTSIKMRGYVNQNIVVGNTGNIETAPYRCGRSSDGDELLICAFLFSLKSKLALCTP